MITEELVSALQDVARRLGKGSVSRTEFIRETGITQSHVLRHFDSWNDLVRAAGLAPNDMSRVSDEDLFRAMQDAFADAGGVCTMVRFRKLARYSTDVYTQRWGRWGDVLTKFRGWVEQTAPGFPYLSELPTGETRAAQPLTGADAAPVRTAAWATRGGLRYGPFLNFRGLQHAPINEQGVVFLFGMVALELGYVVESVATGYPDCEAKRRVRRDQWERVRVEFEYLSRNFHDHGHDPANCDLVVCWEHNWPECPLEVLELKSAVQALGE